MKKEGEKIFEQFGSKREIEIVLGIMVGNEGVIE